MLLYLWWNDDFGGGIMNKIFTIIKRLLLVYLIYFFVSAALIYKIPIKGKTDLSYNVDDIKNISDDNLYAKIIDDTKDALDIRLSIIESATKTIDVSYLEISKGNTPSIFLGSLLKKANEGVKVRIVLDWMKYDYGINFKSISSNSNIEFYLYEPLNLLTPYTLNNILHDKLIAVDNKYGITGGRNITDRFLNEDNNIKVVDRDILVYGDNENSAVKDISLYVDELVQSKYTKLNKKSSKEKYAINSKKLIEDYLDYYNTLETLEQQLSDSIKIDNVKFVRSPLNRFNKQPVMFNVIEDLMAPELLKENPNIILQSPYITPSSVLRKYYNGTIRDKVTFITNNRTTNPNFIGTTGYAGIRKRLAKHATVYEHQGTISHHSKTALIGDDISIIGSLNLDNRSIHLSTESGFVIYSKEFNEELKKRLNIIIDESLQVKKDGSYVFNENVTPLKPKKIKYFFINLSSTITNLLYELI